MHFRLHESRLGGDLGLWSEVASRTNPNTVRLQAYCDTAQCGEKVRSQPPAFEVATFNAVAASRALQSYDDRGEFVVTDAFGRITLHARIVEPTKIGAELARLGELHSSIGATR